MIPSSMAVCVAEMMEIATPRLAECGVRHRVGDPSSLRTPAPVILSWLATPHHPATSHANTVAMNYIQPAQLAAGPGSGYAPHSSFIDGGGQKLHYLKW